MGGGRVTRSALAHQFQAASDAGMGVVVYGVGEVVPVVAVEALRARAQDVGACTEVVA